MEPHKFNQLVSKIRSGGLVSGYYLFGEEGYLKTLLITEIKSAALSPDFAEFNFNEFWTADLKDPKLLFDAILALPMMAERRLVVLREVETANKDLQEKLLQIKIPESCIFVAEAEPDKKTNYHKFLLSHLESVDCSLSGDAEMISWVSELATRLGTKLNPGLARYLVERAGTNLLALAAEIEKLAISKAGSPPTKSDIDELIATSRNANIFALTDNLSARRFAPALQIAERLYNFGESPIKMLSLIKGELFNLALVKSGAPLRCPEWKAKKYRDWAAGWSKSAVRDSIIALSKIDIGLKSGLLTDREAFVQIIAEIASK